MSKFTTLILASLAFLVLVTGCAQQQHSGRGFDIEAFRESLAREQAERDSIKAVEDSLRQASIEANMAKIEAEEDSVRRAFQKRLTEFKKRMAESETPSTSKDKSSTVSDASKEWAQRLKINCGDAIYIRIGMPEACLVVMIEASIERRQSHTSEGYTSNTYWTYGGQKAYTCVNGYLESIYESD